MFMNAQQQMDDTNDLVIHLPKLLNILSVLFPYLSEKQKKIHLFVSHDLTIKPTDKHFNLMVLLV
jgi:hypothetical protein